MKLVLAATGASGAIYLQRLLDLLDPKEHEIHLVLSGYARQVINEELGGELLVAASVRQHSDKTMNVPFVSGSARFDAMVVVPCSMGTLGRIAAGTSETTILRAADVFLKERRKLILVPRETPWNLIHARNVVTVMEAGAIVLPASPGFYSRPKKIEELVDTVVARILDQLGLPAQGAFRWAENAE
ncbi:3-octaprenyl-4-hydroxybenzoate carboxy-lyase [Chthoniobacter flavus Ellin428]|uniref:Flavin prenyltransferase UbiX n=1 Tax=Chthoniobacter flavus Ellin428 TaxID=497964 RepID=B4DB52_9BACT|nr:UbiX family flavin prenyltransferase [Chthoniobacter flavus]EDY16330.1 3-octaprenyl-4-hydroxybenzoate carboxy-lyase [Chthoniobacter flavus Ellin428]TCO90253.1 4-hydroxy-3-polyprenylbenzoate decarboxylase [Chthoniobacter flavus]